MKLKNITQAVLVLVLCLGLAAPIAQATELRLAAAANFTPAAKALAAAFEAETGTKVRLSFGSTGKIYTQIINGAPFDLFFAADAERPEKLEAEGRILPGSRMTYAIGTLVLWSPKETLITDDLTVLKTGAFNRLALANPKTAPYGQAAMEVLAGLGLTDGLRSKMVRGNNIAQTFQFVVSGNADLGFIAASQAGQMPAGSRWVVPADSHRALVQQAVALKTARNPELAMAFLRFIQQPKARALIRAHGYRLDD